MLESLGYFLVMVVPWVVLGYLVTKADKNSKFDDLSPVKHIERDGSFESESELDNTF